MNRAIQKYSNYGDNTYIVIPENNSKWGICPEQDLGVSFNFGYIVQLSRHMKKLLEHIEQLDIINNKKSPDEQLQRISIKYKDKFKQLFDKYHIPIKLENNNFYQTIVSQLSPQYNGFQISDSP